MTALVLTRVNGHIRAALEHGDPRRSAERLGTELTRIQLSPVEAATPLDLLARKYRKQLHGETA
jgi:hypothetical protein